MWAIRIMRLNLSGCILLVRLLVCLTRMVSILELTLFVRRLRVVVILGLLAVY